MSRVRVASCRDDAEAALVEAMLDGHGIHAHISGRHHASMAGFGASAIELVVWVDAEQAEEAAALIAELREGGAANLVDGERPDDDDSESLEDEAADGTPIQSALDLATRTSHRRKRGVALLAGVVVQHGTAHFTIGGWKRGISAAACQIVGWRHVAAGDPVTGFAFVIAAVLFDVIGSQLAIGRSRGPVPPARALPG